MSIINGIKSVAKHLIPLIPLAIKIVKGLFSTKAKELSKEEMNSNSGVVNISEELEKFNTNIKNQFSEIEKSIISKIEEQLNQYIEIAMTLEKYPEIKRNTIEKIKKEIKKHKNSLSGCLLDELRKNISIDNRYLINILKMENSSTKEKMIEEFISKSTKNALKNYSVRVSNDLEDISQDILQEFNYLVEELEEQIKVEIENLKELELATKDYTEKEKIVCNKVLEKVFLESIKTA